jgi:hypothetical protein
MNQLKRIAGADFALLTMLCAGIMGIAMLFGATGCDNGTTKVCECPSGTAHLEGTTCCNGVGCECITRYTAAFDGKTINIDDRSKELSPDKLSAIRTCLSTYSAPTSEINIIKSVLSLIVIEKTNSYTEYKTENNIIYLNVDGINIAGATAGALIEIYNGNATAMFNILNSNIRLASGRDMNAKAGWVAYQRGFSRMAQKWVKNSKIYGT